MAVSTHGGRTVLVLSLVVVLAGSLIGDGVAAGKRRRTQRIVEVAYEGPALAVLVPGALVGYCIPGETPGCFNVPLKATDRYISVDVEDASGQAVYGIVFDESGAEVGDFCGSTTDPVPSPGGAYVDVWLYAGHCYGTTTPSVVTTGTMKITLSNRR